MPSRKHNVGDLLLGFHWDYAGLEKHQVLGIIQSIDKTKKPHKYRVDWVDGTNFIGMYSRISVDAYRKNYLKYAKTQSG